MARSRKYTPWAGSFGRVETIELGPPTGVLTGLAALASFAALGTVSAGGGPVTGVMGAQALAAAFAANGTSGSGILEPGAIFAGDPNFTTNGQWLRADQVVKTGALIDQWTDLSGSGHHMAGTTTRRPTSITSSADFNNQPIVRFVGETEITAERDELIASPTWARPAPGTSPLWVWAVIRAYGPTLGASRMLIADATANAYQVIRASTTNPDLTMRNGSTVNANANAPDATTCAMEWYFANSLSFDYQKLRSLSVTGQNAGNTAGTNFQMSRNQAGNAWAWYDIAELIQYQGGRPTLTQLSQLDAYAVNRYGSGIL